VIFVDTSFWVALRNHRDGRHPEAETLLREIGDQQLVTSNHVRGETWTHLRRKAGHRSAVGFLDHLERSDRVEVVHVDPELEPRALAWLRKHDERDEREYSFVDATSFALMRSLAIHEALAFDGDFAAAGFVELRVPG
jgi:predicted nucleic acid-binding protein